MELQHAWVSPQGLEPPLTIDPFLLHLTRDNLRLRFASGPLSSQGVLSQAQVLPCLSARSAWLALLLALKLPPGSEVLMSAINIPGMVDIVRKVGAIPKAIDLDPHTLLPTPQTLRRALTRRSRVVLVSHLFGSWSPLDELAAICRENSIPLIEDAAECYFGEGFSGTPACSVTLFSFGLMKRSAVGHGALAFVRDKVLLQSMSDEMEGWPLARPHETLERFAKCLAFSTVRHPTLVAGIKSTFAACGKNFEEVFRNGMRGFKGEDWFDKVKRRPSQLLTVLLEVAYATRRLPFERQLSGDRLKLLAGTPLVRSGGFWSGGQYHSCHVLGLNSNMHAFWLAAVSCESPEFVVKHAASQGILATCSSSGLSCFSPLQAPCATRLSESLVYFSWKSLIRFARSTS